MSLNAVSIDVSVVSEFLLINALECLRIKSTDLSANEIRFLIHDSIWVTDPNIKECRSFVLTEPTCSLVLDHGSSSVPSLRFSPLTFRLVQGASCKSMGLRFNRDLRYKSTKVV